MSDDFTTDTIPVSPPSEQAPPSAPDTSEIVNERRHAALSQLAKDENVESYAQEREDQAAHFDRGEDISQQRQNQWFRRASKALQEATLEAQGINTNGQGEQEPTQPPPGYVAGDEAMRQVDYARREGMQQLRFQQYFGGDEEKRKHVIDWGNAMDEGGTVAQWIIESGSQAGPQIVEHLANNPEQWGELAQMPQRYREQALARLEGAILTRQHFAGQMAQQQQQWQQERRVTQAPPPIRPPRGGGALPPRDAYQLAAKGEDASSYIQFRKEQEKRSRD